MDRRHPLLGSTVGFPVIQMDKVDRRYLLQGLTVGLYFLPSMGVYFIQMVGPLSLSCRDPLRARRQLSCRDPRRARR